jgi:hypothetical protein
MRNKQRHANTRERFMTFAETLTRACGAVGEKYFLLPIAGRGQPIRRERVYCYELYHQLRNELQGATLTLTAEPDKSGHPSFGKGRRMNPDFIFHVPGDHSQNAAVIEVECEVTLKHLTKDIKNLKAMQARGYVDLILLLFAVSKVPWDRLVKAAIAADFDLDLLKVVLHSKVGSPAIVAERPRST